MNNEVHNKKESELIMEKQEKKTFADFFCLVVGTDEYPTIEEINEKLNKKNN